MKILNINKSFNGAILAVTLAIGLAGPFSAFAVTATAPNLGTAATFSVLGGDAISTDGSGATVSGDLGHVGAKTGTWVFGGTEFAGGAASGAVTDATNAWNTMGASGGTLWDPSVLGDMTPLPGLYTSVVDPTMTTTLTLHGTATDVWIFQVSDSLTVTDAATVNLTGGAQACNVFWRVASSATINGAPGKKFVGTLIAGSAVSLVTGATVQGRMIARTAALSTAGVTSITGSTNCATVTTTTGGGSAPIPPEPPTLTVIKHVIGGNKVASNFSLAVKIYGQNVAGSPALGLEAGRVYQLAKTGISTVSELPMAGYTSAFSGDCNSKGEVFMEYGDRKTCTITNTVIALVPPLINVEKIPTPLALPAGAGLVTYDYRVGNFGLVAMSNVTLNDDKCANAALISGDTNSDSKLDITETWRYRCTVNVATTTTNIVTVTGKANGFTATDVAEATVVVGLPLTPPLIHLIKEPSVFVLPAGGGSVTYYYTVHNHGTVSLSDVSVTDNKCAGPITRLAGRPGDLNQNNLLDQYETFTFTCTTNLTQTTTNIGTATGHGNGIAVVDISTATVVVAPPKLPNTGVGSNEGSAPRNVILLFGTLMAVAASLGIVLKKRAI